MRDRLIRRLPALFAAAALLFLFAPLLRPSALLAVRDVPVFHLPLRTAFAAAAHHGLPAWNPWIHGGQPILSNPNYAAFYPPTWLGLVVEPNAALNLILLLHAALALAGAWRLARRLGCGRPAAAFAALAFAGGGGFVGIASWVPGFCGFAWLPWILLAADRLFSGGATRHPPAVARLAGVLALQFLAGEPVAVAIAVLGVLCLACRRPQGAGRRLGSLAAAGLLALLLASVQLLPTVLRVRDSARAGGLKAAQATEWSAPPARLAEWVLPRLYGDPLRADDSLYFGWGIHDRQFPYLISIYAGLPVLLLALAALLRWPIPRRAAWAAMAAAGLFVALGRHNPLYAAAAELLPALRLFRYPEKFLLLTNGALAFAAALGWQHLLERRRRGDHGAADFPIALAAVAVGVATLLALLVAARPDVGRWFVRTQSLLPLSAERTAAALAFLRIQSLVTLGTAATTLAVLAAHRLRRPPLAALASAALLLLAIDLGSHGRRLLPTLPLPTVLAEGGLARQLAPVADRVFVDRSPVRTPELTLRSGREGPVTLWNAVDRLDPYVGNLWRISYALNPDTDLMLTGWARHALRGLDAVRDRPEPTLRLLGAWNVTHLVRVTPVTEALATRLRGEPAPPARVLANPESLPRLRFTPRVRFHGDAEEALDAAVRDQFRLARGEHWVRPSQGGVAHSAVDTRAWELRDGHRSLGLRYSASAATYLVAAVTYDRGWRARLDDRPLEIYPTAAGQIGIELPAGEHRLRIAYWDPAVTVGGVLSVATALGTVLAIRGRRRRWAASAGS